MEGTKGTPEKYTGRLGVPSAVHVGKVVVLRIPTPTPTHDGEASDVAGVSRGVSARIVPIKLFEQRLQSLIRSCLCCAWRASLVAFQVQAFAHGEPRRLGLRIAGRYSKGEEAHFQLGR